MRGRPLFLIATALFLGLDLLTKAYAQALPEPQVLIPGLFDLHFLYNEGAAFGSLKSWDASVRIPFFIGISAVATALVVYFAWQAEAGERIYLLALGLILSGVLGNLYDRFVFGKVRDFLHLHVGERWHYWTFNVADAALLIGGVLVVWRTWQNDTAAEAAPPGS